MAATLALLGFSVAAPAADSVHLYRSTQGGCSMADGALSDDPVGGTGPEGARVSVLHNTYADGATGTPVTSILAGESVTWAWASLHCHSITAGLIASGNGEFESGFHWPKEMGFPPLSASLFHYPIPSLAPQLTYTHTFDEPGTYTYFCVHHGVIGMQGVVVVEAA